MVNHKTRVTITTSIAYVNAAPHIGHALEFVQADALARYHRLRGRDVFFLTGTDENSLKNVQAAEREGISTKELVDKYAEQFLRLARMLNISNDDFIRTTEERHRNGAQKLWESCRKNDIYKKYYKGLYCLGCEAFYTQKDLVDEVCPYHRTRPEVVEEENYFFRLSLYQRDLERLIETNKLRVIPESRKNEMLRFIRSGLEDFSISRSRARAKGWGIPVPGDDEQIMYVWFDALSNYLNGVGYADDPEKFAVWWDGSDAIVHMIGKDIIRFHVIYWPAILLSAGLRLPQEIFVHGFITIGGKKLSKSVGAVIDPFAAVEKYGSDAVRYFLLREIPPTEDGDFTFERLEAKYTGDLAHGIGNYASRVLAMTEKFSGGKIPKPRDRRHEDVPSSGGWESVVKEFENTFESRRFDKVASLIDRVVRAWGDAKINEDKPWALAKENSEALADSLYHRAELLRQIGLLLEPFIPDTARKIRERLGEKHAAGKFEDVTRWGGLEPGTRVTKGEPLFPSLQ